MKHRVVEEGVTMVDILRKLSRSSMALGSRQKAQTAGETGPQSKGDEIPRVLRRQSHDESSVILWEPLIIIAGLDDSIAFALQAFV